MGSRAKFRGAGRASPLLIDGDRHATRLAIKSSRRNLGVATVPSVAPWCSPGSRGALQVAEAHMKAPLLIIMGVVVLVAGSGVAIMNNACKSWCARHICGHFCQAAGFAKAVMTHHR